MKVSFTVVSGNSKTGPIPVSRTEESSCPSTCPFKGHGCYAEHGHLRGHWKRTALNGMQWDHFVAQIRALPRKQLWRHNDAGDLPHLRGTINRAALRKLVAANKGRNGFTYTHHVLSPANVKTLQEANANGFTVNISCETVEQVDEARRLGLPAVLVLPRDGVAKGTMTPDGHPIRVCPASIGDMTCSRCGICARADRQTVIGFPAHGTARAKVEHVLNNV